MVLGGDKALNRERIDQGHATEVVEIVWAIVYTKCQPHPEGVGHMEA